jgi:hypothetical protein
MKVAPEPTSNRSPERTQTTRAALPQIDYSYQSAVRAIAPVSAKSEARRAELKTFRVLSRNFFGVEAGREALKESLVFAGIMVVAAWPLSVVLNQLGTMMISPPPWPL